uniref:NADH dehydrogenase subunit 4L n=1 Tax=Apanteles gelechiidivoris TaxID=1911542 RepID=UPI00286A1A65|nr:NADH dehydrogenase subunit 4L [Apanteles gelechiidivoris]WKW91669.1 NADH dehydrogenase subunit 4L [Apanteles gelechiidivoris]WLN31487.1 NADH dehydrogenase subunit 4L [Apanteles gelechiidivoris]
MLNWNFNLTIILFLISIFMYSSFYKHLLMSLISLEFMILNLSLMMYYNLYYLKLNMFLMSFFWTISVCESIMGLTILVFLVRKLGNDFTKMLNIIN